MLKAMLKPLTIIVLSLFVTKILRTRPSGPNTILLSQLHSHFPSAQKCDKNIILGWNTCIDLLVNASTVANDLNLTPTSTNAVDHENIPHLVALQESLSFWFSKGGAAERLMSNAQAEEIFGKVVAAANNDPKARLRVGGNAALMATSLAKFGCNVHLGGPIGSTLAKRLETGIQFTSTNITKDMNDVIDPIHLILEYQKGQRLGDMVAPRANRYILVHDPLNARLAGLEPLRDYLRLHTNVQQYDVFVASGLNQLEALATPELRSERLRAVRSAIQELPMTLPVHLELASMTDTTFLQSMASTMFPVANSFGLNEEELLFTFNALHGYFSTKTLTENMLTGKVPNVDAVVEALEFIVMKTDEWADAASRSSGDDGDTKNKKEKEDGKSDGNSDVDNTVRRISRIHFHALSYHIIADRNVAGRHLWNNDLSKGVAAGSVIATLNACGKHPDVKTKSVFDHFFGIKYPKENELDLLYQEKCGVRGGGQEYNGVCVWKHGEMTYSLAPVLVAKHPVNTVGLGDSISSSGLLYSL